MQIEDFNKLTKTMQANVLAWADYMCGGLARVIEAKSKFEKLPSTYGDSLGYTIRMIQSKFPQPISKRAQQVLKETLEMDVTAIEYDEQKTINRKYKQHFNLDTSRLNAGALHWEHYNGGIKELTKKLINLEKPINDPIELLNFISENTHIIVKLKGVEDHIDHNTSIEGLKLWDNI